jgi:PAS domain S-box-containing protein
VLLVFTNITDRKKVEEGLRQRNRELELLNRASQAFGSTLELDQVLNTTLEEVRHLLDVVASSIWLIDLETDELCCWQATGPQGESVRGWRLAPREGLAGWVAHNEKSAIIADTRTDERYFTGVDRQTGMELRSVLSVPMQVKEDVIGVLQVADTTVGRFDMADLRLLEPLASSAAIAIENARLFEQAQHEIAERKRAEEALQQSERMARALLDATTESILLIDNQKTILALNQTAAQRMGKRVEALVGLSAEQHVRHLISPNVVTARMKHIDEVIRSGKPVRFEDERDGILFDTNIYPVFDENDKVTQLAIFAQDITMRKKAERQAAQAERLAATGRLAAGLAHEINNPLQSIRSNLELITDFDLEPEERKEYLPIIYQEFERLTELTRRVLDFARPPAETCYPSRIANLVQNTLALVRKQLQDAHIQVTTDLPADLSPVLVVPAQIVQVLLNLIMNAAEAMPDGGSLHIAAQAKKDAIALAVTNDGPAIPEEHIRYIFDPFYTTRPNGTGLGLAISHSIIQQHNGTIGVENLADNQGVTFTFTLPIAYPAGTQEATA